MSISQKHRAPGHSVAMFSMIGCPLHLVLKRGLLLYPEIRLLENSHRVRDTGMAPNTKGSPSYTREGFEQAVGINHLGHFLMANLLIKVQGTKCTRNDTATRYLWEQVSAAVRSASVVSSKRFGLLGASSARRCYRSVELSDQIGDSSSPTPPPGNPCSRLKPV